jgi:hypothetical protein
MTRGIHSREIVKSDLDQIASLLTTALGFSKEYFSQIMEKVTHLSTPIGFPKYGYVLLSDDVIVGAILMIFATIRLGAVRCHVAAWTVDPAYRPYATLFFSKALRFKDVTYLNILGNPRMLPLVKVQGFSMCSDGQFAAIPVLSRGSGDRPVKLVSADAAPNTHFDSDEHELLLTHRKCGCTSLWCITQEGAHPFVFQPRSTFPGMQLIYCRDIEEFVRFARPIGLFLALRGSFYVVVNSNGPIPGLVGKYFPGVMPLYFKGPPPHIGDLAYTRFALHVRPRIKLGHRLLTATLSKLSTG